MILTRRRALIGGAAALLLPRPAIIRPARANLVMAPTASAGAYVGAGDIVSGWTAWYGLRAYSAAVAATGTQKAINVRRSSDNTTMDILILTNGKVDTATASTFIGGGSGFVTKWYDQSGHGNDASQATAGQQPQLTFSFVGTFPSLSFVYTNTDCLLGSISGGAISQPFTFTAVVEGTGAVSGRVLSTWTGSVGALLGFDTSTPDISLYAGSNIQTSATDSALHAVSAVADTTSSVVNIDGTETTGDSGTNATSAFIGIGSDTGGLTPLSGYILECGILPVGATSGQRTSLNSNAHAVIGF